MKTKIDVCDVEGVKVDQIRQIFDSKEFKEESILHYEGQIPVVAYFVSSGSIDLIKNNKARLSVKKGQILGLKELYFHSSSGVKAVAKANSTLHFIDYSTIKEIMGRPEDDATRRTFEELIEKPYKF